MNKHRDKQRKQAQRDAARHQRQAERLGNAASVPATRPPISERGPAVLHRYNPARAVAHDVMGLRYGRLYCPRGEFQLESVSGTPPEGGEKEYAFRRDQVPVSWETLTEKR